MRPKEQQTSDNLIVKDNCFIEILDKGPVKLIKRVKIAQSFLVCVRSVPPYRFKLAYVILQMAVKNFSKPTSKNGDMGPF